MTKKYQTIFNSVCSFANATWREILRCDLHSDMISTRFEHVSAIVTFDDESEWIFRADGTFERRGTTNEI